MDSILARVESTIKSLGVDHFGLTPLDPPLSYPQYQEWLDHGYHGDMKYLETHAPAKKTPRAFFPEITTAIVIAESYFPHPQPRPGLQLKTALYAQGADYHGWFKEKLLEIATELNALYPLEKFICFTDSGPILERDLAARAGLGWVGKNTCLIDRKKGSLFFLGQILTSLKLSAKIDLSPDHCGTCTRCLDACPTGALENPRVLNANKCISYLTIETQSIPSPRLREQIGEWFFGCDICQTVCPWNQKILKKELTPSASREELARDIKFILSSPNRQLARIFKESPLSRARPFGLKRNALIVAANCKLTEVKDEILRISQSDLKLKELAEWALNQLEPQTV